MPATAPRDRSQTLLPGHRENGVLVGQDGMLFLAGGAHHVEEYVTGARPLDDRSIGAFRANLQHREGWARRKEAKYLHVVTPDKQSIVPHLWPAEGKPVLRLTELMQARLPAPPSSLRYPLALLARHAAAALSRVDTHYNDTGAILVAADIAEALLGTDEAACRDALLAQVTRERTWSGDLGSKLDPAVSEAERVFHGASPARLFSNNITAGNNGIMDIWLNAEAPSATRLAFFGDSFGRHLCKFLCRWFREIVFVRSPWFHPEMASLFRPHHIVTQNVERYLASVPQDDRRPHFLLLPHLKGEPYAPPAEFVQVLSACLAVGRRSYDQHLARYFPG